MIRTKLFLNLKSGFQYNRYFPDKVAIIGPQSEQLYLWLENIYTESNKTILFLNYMNNYTIQNLHNDNFITVATEPDKTDTCEIKTSFLFPANNFDNKESKYKVLAFIDLFNEFADFNPLHLIYPKTSLLSKKKSTSIDTSIDFQLNNIYYRPKHGRFIESFKLKKYDLNQLNKYFN